MSDPLLNSNDQKRSTALAGGRLDRGDLWENVFTALHVQAAILDRTGSTVAVNPAWVTFDRENEFAAVRSSTDVGYLRACRAAFDGGDPVAGEIVRAIESVLSGSASESLTEYSSVTPTTTRWFNLRVQRLPLTKERILLTRTEITELKEAQNSLSAALAEVEQLKSQIQRETVCLKEKIKSHNSHHQIVGQSAAIRRVLAQAEQVAKTDSTVLLLGETGTGKELVASYIHELSSRNTQTMVSVNCAAMPESLVESELFGREKGAFTGSLSRQIGRFELAHNSTIFLDELGEIPLEVQAKLLRVLESRQIARLGNPKPIPINVRIVAATNRNLEEAIRAGKFRQDLYYRLHVFPIDLPPLRERPEDIPPLVWSFVDEFARAFNKNIESIQRESLEALQRHSWPGNVRELRNVIERAMIVNTGPKLRIQLPPAVVLAAAGTGRKLEEVEREHILDVLEKAGWRIRGTHGAAEKLGIKPTTLEARMAKLGIRRPSTLARD